MPYGDDEVAALVQVAGPADRVLVLLGAHAGLRAQECADLRWAEVHLARRDLLVRRGKGGKQRLVVLSASLRQSLATLPRRADGFVLGYRTAGSAWRHMYVLCTLAGVAELSCFPSARLLARGDGGSSPPPDAQLTAFLWPSGSGSSSWPYCRGDR